jgi:hypothetical protein
MHEIGHALGFARHSKDNDVMAAYVEKDRVIRIPTLSRFLTGMYKLDVGVTIPLKEFYAKNESATAWSDKDGSINLEDESRTCR